MYIYSNGVLNNIKKKIVYTNTVSKFVRLVLPGDGDFEKSSENRAKLLIIYYTEEIKYVTLLG